MHGLTPALQGPASTAMGGVDLSWLAGGLTSAAAYALLGGRVHDRYAQTPVAVPRTAAVPVPEHS
jgi:toxin CptA